MTGLCGSKKGETRDHKMFIIDSSCRSEARDVGGGWVGVGIHSFPAHLTPSSCVAICSVHGSVL